MTGDDYKTRLLAIQAEYRADASERGFDADETWLGKVIALDVEWVTNGEPTAVAHGRHDLKGCARCGGDHAGLVYRPMARPVPDPDGEFTHWTPCPTTGDPILMRYQDRQEAAS